MAFIFCSHAIAAKPCEELLTTQVELPQIGFLGAADNSDELLAKTKEAYSSLLRVYGAGIVSIKDLELLVKAGQAGVAVQKQKTRPIEERKSTEVWNVVDTLSNGVQVWQHKELGIFVTDVLEGKYMHQKAVELCASLESPKSFPRLKWTLPSGYPKNLNGQEGFLNLDSDFVSLEANGIRKLLPKMKGKWFWSSSGYPYDTDVAFFFGGNDGGIYDYGRSVNVSVLCIAR